MTGARGAPGDSISPGPGAWLRVRVLFGTLSVAGVQLEFTPLSGDEPTIGISDADGNVAIFLSADTYAITASTLATTMPWFRIASISPAFVTIHADEEDTPPVEVTLIRNPDVALPKSELSVWVGQDRTAPRPIRSHRSSRRFTLMSTAPGRMSGSPMGTSARPR